MGDKKSKLSINDEPIKSMWQDSTRIEDAKSKLLDFYTSQQSSQAERLIGFVIALFALLTLAQGVDKSRLGTLFTHVSSITALVKIVPLSGCGWETMKFIILFAGVTLLFFFILRAIYRFAVFGKMFSAVQYVTTKDVKQWIVDFANDKNINLTEDANKADFIERSLWATLNAAARIALIDEDKNGKTKQKRVPFLPICWFITHDDPDPKFNCKENCGYLSLFLSSLFLAFLLILILW